jgi:diguanylate cyclase
MRQSDIIDSIREIIVGASIDASPENYDICHRFVVRSDTDVCAGFDAALAKAQPISADAFGAIRERAAPARGQIDAFRFMAKVDAQLVTLADATSDALGHAQDYSRSLDATAADLKALDLSPEAASIIAGLAAQTSFAARRAAALEASLAQASGELADLRQELERTKTEGSSDALTSLPNRRAFDSRLLDAISIAHAARQPLSIAFCDVDHFKKFNDTWGHQLGDQVLRFVGAQLAKQFAEIGVPARFGGEEFVVILPNHGSAEAFDAIDRFCGVVRSRVLRVRSDNREVGHVTLSAGVATLRRDDTATSLVERADAAMYAAKRSGRDRVMFST